MKTKQPAIALEPTEDSDATKKKAALKESQRKILEQFQAKQKAFQLTNSESLSEEIEGGEEVPECCLCKDISDNYTDNPIALISYMQTSRNLELNNKLVW